MKMYVYENIMSNVTVLLPNEWGTDLFFNSDWFQQNDYQSSALQEKENNIMV